MVHRDRRHRRRRGISVITDLPHHVTKAQDISQQNGVIKQINGDTAPCVFALKESFSFYRDEMNHTLAGGQPSTVKNYLLEDQTACSFASGPVYDMTNNIQPIDTSRGQESGPRDGRHRQMDHLRRGRCHRRHQELLRLDTVPPRATTNSA